MDLDALILANGADYLLRKIVDRAVCKECGGVEIGVTVGVAGAPGYSYPTIARGDPPPAESRLPGQLAIPVLSHVLVHGLIRMVPALYRDWQGWMEVR